MWTWRALAVKTPLCPFHGEFGYRCPDSNKKCNSRPLSCVPVFERVFECSTDDLEMYSRSKDLLTVYFCSEKEGLRREKVVELCFKDSLAFVLHFHILDMVSWIWTNPSTDRLKFESPSKWNSSQGFNFEHCRWCLTNSKTNLTLWKCIPIEGHIYGSPKNGEGSRDW